MKRLMQLVLFALLLGTGTAAAQMRGNEVCRYRGNVGPYAVTMILDATYSHSCGQEFVDYEGSYSYSKAGNSLRLEGYSIDSGKIILQEYTAKGRNSATWQLTEDRSGNLSGIFINNSSKKTFKVSLRRISRK